MKYISCSYIFVQKTTRLSTYLHDLNKVQYDAVTYTNGPSLVIAGAGSGKTRVLTYKIAHLLENGFAPSSILALTFTNKAAREMKDRITQLTCPNLAKYLWMGTFHSVFSRILRAESEALGFSSSFTIYDTTDSRSLIKSIVKELKLDDKTYKPSVVHSRISMAKNNLIMPTVYANTLSLTEYDKYNKMPAIKDIYQVYMNRCKKAGAMDFDDLLLYTNILFRDHPQILEKYRSRFSFILVDEYQDTNVSQNLITKKLSELHKRICVVGDDAQSIYSFRGAKLDNILQFPTDYEGCKVFKLEQNYRSTQNIVKAANSLIDKNEEQFKKNSFSEKPEGCKIQLIQAFSDIEEGYAVAHSIYESHLITEIEYQDFAILYRTNAQSRVMEEALRKKNIPYKVYGGLSFYARKEIKDIIAYFRLSVNNNDIEAFKRVINYPARGIGKTTLDKLFDAATQYDTSVWNICLNPNAYDLSINQGTISKLQKFIGMVESFQSKLEQYSAYDIAHYIITNTGIYKEFTGDTSVETISKKENVDELLNALKDFTETKKEAEEPDRLIDFLTEVSLITDQDTDSDEDKNKVSLMTVHASKGLEFKNIYIVGMEEELFPSPRSNDSKKDLEEERRLFYVAITRAEDQCTISYAKSRYKYGSPTFCRPSRFLRDLNPLYIAVSPGVSMNDALGLQSETKTNNLERSSNSTPSFYGNRSALPSNKSTTPIRKMQYTSSSSRQASDNSNFKADDPRKIKTGMTVEHIRFGRGYVEGIEGMGENIKAMVKFNTAGNKNLLLRFAKLRIIKE